MSRSSLSSNATPARAARRKRRGRNRKKWRAEQAALRVAGVKAVVNLIEVRLAEADVRTDEDIARAARRVLDETRDLPDTIKVVLRTSLSPEAERKHQTDLQARSPGLPAPAKQPEPAGT